MPVISYQFPNTYYFVFFLYHLVLWKQHLWTWLLIKFIVFSAFIYVIVNLSIFLILVTKIHTFHTDILIGTCHTLNTILDIGLKHLTILQIQTKLNKSLKYTSMLEIWSTQWFHFQRMWHRKHPLCNMHQVKVYHFITPWHNWVLYTIKKTMQVKCGLLIRSSSNSLRENRYRLHDTQLVWWQPSPCHQTMQKNHLASNSKLLVYQNDCRGCYHSGIMTSFGANEFRLY